MNEIDERETTDLLDRALLKAENSHMTGTITPVEYHKIKAKIDSLKKLRFTEEYEGQQDREMFEYMKYKVAAEVGGDEEKEAFRLYEKTRIADKGETQYRLLAQRAADDPILKIYA